MDYIDKRRSLILPGIINAILLIVTALAACTVVKGNVAGNGDQSECYTVTVFMRNTGGFPGGSVMAMKWPDRIDIPVEGIEGSPITKVVYNRMSQSQYTALCHLLKGRPDVLSIQRNIE